jgi:hypothetical protein
VTFNRLVRTILVALLGLTGLTVSASASYADPSQPVEMPGTGHHYQLVTGTYTWDRAEFLANNSMYQGMHGHLVTITSEGENLFLQQIAQGDRIWAGGKDFGTQDGFARNWTWTDGPERGTTLPRSLHGIRATHLDIQVGFLVSLTTRTAVTLKCV